MDVNADSSPYRHEHDGESYYFCCEHCLIKFRENPDKYLAPASHSKRNQRRPEKGNTSAHVSGSARHETRSLPEVWNVA